MSQGDLAPLGQPTWIEASAGTGKTWTLERIALARVEEGAGIESILVVTFTDKATREMRARIRRTLAARAAALADEGDAGRVALGRVRAALFDFDRATIATLHGFCRRTLREHAFLGGRALEESQEGHALDGTLARAWLARRLDGSGPLRAVLEASLTLLGPERLIALLLELCRERSPMLPSFSAEALDHALAAIPSGVALEAALVDLVEHAGPHPASRARLTSAMRGLDQARSVAGEPRLPALFAWAAGEVGDEVTAAWVAARAAESPLGGPLSVVARSLATPLPALVSLALPDLREAISTGKARANVVDFDELVLGMRRALEGPRGEGLVRLVRERYRHVIVDEFQDTDPDQWAILKTLFFDCTPDRSLVLIGDPKQAIYGFRGADVHTYLRAEGEVRAVGVERRLGVSFRATPALLEALHQILVPGEGEPVFFSRAHSYDEPVVAGEATRDAVVLEGDRALPLPPLTVLSIRGEPPLRLKPGRRALARAIGEEIRRLLSQGVWVGTPDARRRIGAADVFVLTRSLAEGTEIAEALTRAGVPNAFFKQDGLFRTAEARDFCDLLTALAAPEDRERMLRALATPFFGVAPEDYGALTALPEDHPLVVRFRTLAALSQERPVAEVLPQILEVTGITCRELYLFASERRLTNYLHLTEVLAEIAREHDASLRELGSRLALLLEGRGGEAEDVQRLPGERAAVQILTMHKAKGLEAEVVFIYGGLGRPRSPPHARRIGTTEAGARIAWLLPRSDGTSDPAIEASIEREERQESERLAYVAMTRARSLLYLPFFEAASDPSRPGRLRGAYRVIHDRLSALRARRVLESAPFRVEPITPGAGGGGRGGRREPLAAPEPHLLEPTGSLPSAGEFERLAAQRSGHVVTSYSRMKREREQSGDSGELEAIARYAEDDPVRVTTPEDPSGAAFGVAVHKVLELVPPAKVAKARDGAALLADPEVVQLGLAALAEGGLDERALPLLGDLVFGGLTTRLPSEQGGVALYAPTRRAVEVPFVHVLPEASHPPPSARMTAREPLAVERGYLRGVLDLLFEHEGRLYVVDWKTDRLAAYDAASVQEHVRESYAIQLRLYALAIRRMIATEPRGGPRLDDRLGGVLFVLLRGRTGAAPRSGPLLERMVESGVFFHRPTRTELDAWDAELRRSDTPFGYPLGLLRGGAGRPRRGAELGPRRPKQP